MSDRGQSIIIFHIIFTKSVKIYVLAYFGLSLILHTENGQEFVNQYISKLKINWDGDCAHKRGKPRAPHAQGLVEQGNGTLKKMIQSMQAQFKVKQWHTLLTKIQYNLNTQKSTCMLIIWLLLHQRKLRLYSKIK